MFALVAKAIMVFQYIFYGENKRFVEKQSILSELKGNYTDNQTHRLIVARPPSNMPA